MYSVVAFGLDSIWNIRYLLMDSICMYTAESGVLQLLYVISTIKAIRVRCMSVNNQNQIYNVILSRGLVRTNRV